MNQERFVVGNEISISEASRRPRVDPLDLASVGQVRARSTALSGRDFAMVSLALAFVAVVGLLYLLQSAEVTRLAYRVGDRRAELERVVQENSVLRAEVLELTRLDRIEARAEALGLEVPAQVLYLSLGGVGAEATAASEAAPGP